MSDLEQARKIFSKDRFATEAAGIVIDKVDNRRAVCSMVIEEKHLNAGNGVMGGAIFTLADFTFAVASNFNQPLTVSSGANINFLGTCKGNRLIGTAVCEKTGRTTCVYTVHIDDDLGNKVALVVVNGFIINK